LALSEHASYRVNTANAVKMELTVSFSLISLQKTIDGCQMPSTLSLSK
jgi:hypothetical protein